MFTNQMYTYHMELQNENEILEDFALINLGLLVTQAREN